MKGKFRNAAAHEDQVFFDFGSSVIDAEEKAKIERFLDNAPSPPAVVVAKASEEGGAAANQACAKRRGDAVAAQIAKRAAKPKVVVSLDGTVDNPDYRRLRRVNLAPPSAKNDECFVDPACDANLVTAIGAAQKLARRGASAAEVRNPAIRVAMQDAFHASDDATADFIEKTYGDIDKELEALKAPDRHACRTPCTHPKCEIARAFYEAATKTMIGCPGLKDTADKTVDETVLHEAVHAAQPNGDDYGRLFEPIFPFLTTEFALHNPDSFVEFVRIVSTGVRTTPRAPTGGFDGSFTPEEEAAVGKSIAWTIKRLLKAGETANDVYEGLISGNKDPSSSELGDIAEHRTLLKKQGFGVTSPPTAPVPEDQWRVAGLSNRIEELVFDAGSKPKVKIGTSVHWSRKNNLLQVPKAFFAKGVSEQARDIEFALIRNDPDIPMARAGNYLLVIDSFGRLDVSATEGKRP